MCCVVLTQEGMAGPNLGVLLSRCKHGHSNAECCVVMGTRHDHSIRKCLIECQKVSRLVPLPSAPHMCCGSTALGWVPATNGEHARWGWGGQGGAALVLSHQLGRRKPRPPGVLAVLAAWASVLSRPECTTRHRVVSGRTTLQWASATLHVFLAITL